MGLEWIIRNNPYFSMTTYSAPRDVMSSSFKQWFELSERSAQLRKKLAPTAELAKRVYGK